MSITEYVKNGKTGGVEGVCWNDNVFRIEKKPDHYVKHNNLGYGTTPEAFERAQALGMVDVEIIAHDGKRWRVSIADYLRYAVKTNLGRGDQLFISKRSLDWIVKHQVKKNQPIQMSF